jgi:hypothetical protein
VFEAWLDGFGCPLLAVAHSVAALSCVGVCAVLRRGVSVSACVSSCVAVSACQRVWSCVVVSAWQRVCRLVSWCAQAHSTLITATLLIVLFSTMVFGALTKPLLDFIQGAAGAVRGPAATRFWFGESAATPFWFEETAAICFGLRNLQPLAFGLRSLQPLAFGLRSLQPLAFAAGLSPIRLVQATPPPPPGRDSSRS